MNHFGNMDQQSQDKEWGYKNLNQFSLKNTGKMMNNQSIKTNDVLFNTSFASSKPEIPQMEEM